MKTLIITASSFGAAAVIFGAFGAHALRDRLEPAQLASWETGVRYQLAHALALLIIALLSQHGLSVTPSAVCFTLGMVFFSGSIYLLSLGWGPKALLGPITPIGGLLLISGWIALAISAATSK